MALWQWDVWIVPRKEVIRIHSVMPEYMDQDWFESEDWWRLVSESELATFFNSVLPDYSTPWAKNTRSWGSDNGDRIELMVENGKITDVLIRVDLRNLNLDFLNSLVSFSKLHNFVFYSLESNRFIEPNLKELLGSIEKSRKIVFLKDPQKFFSDKKYLDAVDKENRRKLNDPL